MKNYSPVLFLFKVFLFLLSENCTSQINSEHLREPHKIKIIESHEPIGYGLLYSVSDSSVIVISEKEYYNMSHHLNFNKTIIPYSNIDNLKIERNTNFWIPVGITTLLGASIGAISGYTGGTDETHKGYSVSFSAKEKAAILGAGGALLGVITGITIGIIRVNIPINIKIHKQYFEFEKRKNSLLKKSILNY